MLQDCIGAVGSQSMIESVTDRFLSLITRPTHDICSECEGKIDLDTLLIIGLYLEVVLTDNACLEDAHCRGEGEW